MKKFIYWLPSLCWMGFIFYLSGRTGSELGSLFPFIQDFNFGHFLAYFVLSACFYYALARTTSQRNLFFRSVFYCLLYGFTDEFHQFFVPSRSPDLSDLVNDIIGAALAAFLIHLAVRKKHKLGNYP